MEEVGPPPYGETQHPLGKWIFLPELVCHVAYKWW